MKSVSVLGYKQVEQKIDDIARDFSPTWMSAIEVLDDETYLGMLLLRIQLIPCRR